MNQTKPAIDPREVAEIERHKYFLSEKAGHDIGWQVAKQDWESNYAEQFRRSSIRKSQAHGPGGIRTFLKSVLAKAKAR